MICQAAAWWFNHQAVNVCPKHAEIVHSTLTIEYEYYIEKNQIENQIPIK